MAANSAGRYPQRESSDEQIAALYYQNGEKALAGLLYERYSHLVLGLCLKYLKNKMEAEDAVMQIFSNLMNDLRRHKVEHFKSWLYVYSKNFCLMALRKRQNNLKRELDLKDETMPVMDFASDLHLKEREEQIMQMEKAIEELNEHQRICLKLFYLENHSYNDVARLAGFSVNEVKSHIQNGKRNLRLKLEKKNEGARE